SRQRQGQVVGALDIGTDRIGVQQEGQAPRLARRGARSQCHGHVLQLGTGPRSAGGRDGRGAGAFGLGGVHRLAQGARRIGLVGLVGEQVGGGDAAAFALVPQQAGGDRVRVGAARIVEVGPHQAEQAAGLDRGAVDDGLLIGGHAFGRAGLGAVGLSALGVFLQLGHLVAVQRGVQRRIGQHGLRQAQADRGVGRGAVVLQRPLGGGGGGGRRGGGVLLLSALAGCEGGRDGGGGEKDAKGARRDHAGLLWDGSIRKLGR